MIALILALQVALGSVRVIDGDTVHDNRRGEDYRLAAIDAPETGGRAGCEREKRLGQLAKDGLAEILREADTVVAIPAWDPHGRTRWPESLGRRLARLEADGQDVATLMVAKGLAAPMDMDAPFDWCAEG